MSGYHLNKISKGIYGEASKIQEELDELNDALKQDNKILALVELSDIYGALEAVAEKYNITMDDLKKMSNATKRAFNKGIRK
jgi:ATP phosphoribosyltransferase regulatory subunit HisZ